MFFKPIYSAFKEKIHESQKNVIKDLLDIFFWGGEGWVLQTFRTLRLGTNHDIDKILSGARYNLFKKSRLIPLQDARHFSFA